MIGAFGHLVIAAGGPVIPSFGKASNCIVQNHQFCMSWFLHNFSSRFEPRLVEHLQLTAIAVGIALAVTWTGLAIAYYSPYPVGFWITSLSFALYVLARVGRALAARRLRRVALA